MDYYPFDSPDHPALMRYEREINAEAEIAGVPPCALAAIVWRESGGTNEFQIGVPPGRGCGVGLTQITDGVNWADVADPTFAGYHLLTPADNLYVAAAYFLAPLIASALRLQRDEPETFQRFGNGQALYYAYSGYNAGWGAVLSALADGVDPDLRTSNGYAADTFAKYCALLASSKARRCA